MALSKIVSRCVGTITASNYAEIKTLQEIPKPAGALPLLGHYMQVRRRPGNLSDLYLKHFQDLGPIFRLEFPGGKNLVCFADPDAMEAVYRAEGVHPVRTYAGPANFQWFYKKKNLPTPFVFLTGEEWKNVRSMHKNQILPKSVHQYIPGFVRATERLTRNISESETDDEGYIKDVHSLVRMWSMEGSAYFTFGADIDCAKSDLLPDTEKFQQGFTTLVSTVDDFTTALPFFKIFPSKIVKRLSKATDDLYGIGQKYAGLQSESMDGSSLLAELLQEGKMSKEESIMSAIFIMAAAVDTVSCNSSFVLYELAKHPDIQEKVHKQVTSVLGDENEITGDMLQRMPYLGQVIKEAQRMSPVSANHIRTITKDVNILGYNLPAQTLTMYSMLAVARSENYFQNPMKFDPDRWSRDKIHPFSIIPYGIGPKSCWGRRYAEARMKILLASLCRNYKLQSTEAPSAQLKVKEKLFRRPVDPVRIKFIQRQ